MTDLLAGATAAVDEGIGRVCTACVLLVEHRGERATYAAGSLCPDPEAGPDAACDASSLFDLASLTKLATTALCLALVRDRVLDLQMPLREIVPDFRGPGKDAVTIGHVLTHTAGLAWWKTLYEEATSAEEAVWLAAQEPLAQSVGTYTYSDLGYVMLTAGLALAADAPFADAIRARILAGVGAETCDFGPRSPERCAATERDEKLRQRRVRGEVHDENAFAMGGVAGHAGLFGTAADVAALARVFGSGAVIGNELASLARREHARGENARRGLGVALRAPEGAMCGRFLGADAWGHSGFTGTSLWADPELDLVVVLLTNRVYFGRANDEDVYRFRIAVHEAVSGPLVTSAR
ncbi:MAG: beta-lactamase family protein [Chloroflexota bacterium]|nr:beta-lactamase family protein [Chloroflexota bacterium]